MLVPLWGMQELNAVWHLTHICMELPACCVWLPLEPQLEWKHQTSWWTCHTTTGYNPGVTSQLGAADCCLPPTYMTACRVAALSCAPHTRAAYLRHASERGSRAVISGFMTVFMCHPWDSGPELDEAGLNRSNAAAHMNGQRSIPRGLRLSICSSVHVIKMLLAIYASALLWVHVFVCNFCFYYYCLGEENNNV